MLHRSFRRRYVLAVLATAAALISARPEDGRAAKSPLRTCTDAAWADYNECLMETDSWLFRKGCDFTFGLEYERCHIVFWRETLGT